MHDCPHCGTSLLARPSYCDTTDQMTYPRVGSSTVLLIALGGFAIAAVLLVGRALIG